MINQLGQPPGCNRNPNSWLIIQPIAASRSIPYEWKGRGAWAGRVAEGQQLVARAPVTPAWGWGVELCRAALSPHPRGTCRLPRDVSWPGQQRRRGSRGSAGEQGVVPPPTGAGWELLGLGGISVLAPL